MRLTHPTSEQVIEVRDDVAGRYVQQGWRPATPGSPKASASKADWLAFAVSQGLDPVEAEGMTRDELRAALA